MTISTIMMKAFSPIFMLFNLVIFWTAKILVLNNMVRGQSLIVTYTIIVAAAIVTCGLYIMLDLRFIRKMEKNIMDNSIYVEQYGCSLFAHTNAKFVLKFKKDSHELYMNQIFLSLTQYKSDIPEYITNLKARFSKLKMIDIFLIYLSKYFSTISMSILLFVTWQICDSIHTKINIFAQIGVIFATVLVLICIYFFCTRFCLILINRIMRKRDLDFFVIKNLDFLMTKFM